MVMQDFNLRRARDEATKQVICRALDYARGNRREAAQLLGISLRTIFYYLNRFQLRDTNTEGK